jgi:hypothetical protein
MTDLVLVDTNVILDVSHADPVTVRYQMYFPKVPLICP